MSIAAIICAAGYGKRMQLGKNKQFLNLRGKPLIIHTLEQWEKVDGVERIVLVAAPDEIALMQELVKGYELQKNYLIVGGGSERQDSVYLGLSALENTSCDYVLVHDGARPFTGKEEIEGLITQMLRKQACTLAVPVKDTIKQVDASGAILQTLERSTLWAVQTPQGFRYELLMKAHLQARESGILATDDAALVERLGHPVYIVQGRSDNLKLTTPEDILLAEFILERGEKG